MRKEALLLAAGLAFASCAPHQEGAPVPPPASYEVPTPSSTTTTLGQQAIAECLKTGSEMLDASRFIRPAGSPECTEYVGKLFDTMATDPMYRPYLTSAEPYFGYAANKAGRLQGATGIPFTGVFDALTVQTMQAEVVRMTKPQAGCETDTDPNAWSLTTLVDHLSAMGAFTVTYPFIGASRTDLLSPEKSSAMLIQELSALTHWAMCNSVKFNVLDVNTGHAQQTLSGGESQHVTGHAVDIRPFNGDMPMPAWSAQPTDPLTANEWISHNPSALVEANKIFGFLATRAANLSQVIWTDGAQTIQNSQVRPNFSRGPGVDPEHHDHIHIGIREAA